MAVNVITYDKEHHKVVTPVTCREQYLSLRDSETNRRADKHHMVQMNYSCMPTPPADTTDWDGSGPLRGCTIEANTVGMDIDLPAGGQESGNSGIRDFGNSGILDFRNSGSQKSSLHHTESSRDPELQKSRGPEIQCSRAPELQKSRTPEIQAKQISKSLDL